ncbi:TIGR00730 family Rossman fold protein [Streptomyces sp. AJS327]|uniref:LOG family protein n=1 Tax=Streptomyces sp. AJS327 TaxID=2545265 RepID=UPI0015DF2337|nr:TIGR00730 family Rossman fold protein [Streptomyces sp. AJS327]MBA0051722.1 TIGR00730 family Rossman fold protein [Streptomyces sp. AJS327]
MVAKNSSPSAGRPARNICVFCSAAELGAVYTEPAREFAELIGGRGHSLIWGGSNVGLMRVIADGVRHAGGGLVGVSVEFLRDKARTDADEMIVTRDLAERKALLLQRADAIAVLAGGTGTLDEATDILELKKHGMHAKPVVFLNSAGFYDGLRLQMERMEAEGFLPRPLADLAGFATTPAEALEWVEG